MLHINDANQSATPADENKKQEHEELEPLPWEVGKGFLWGFPATLWLIIRHPTGTLGNLNQGNLFQAFSFAFICSGIGLLLSWCKRLFIIWLLLQQDTSLANSDQISQIVVVIRDMKLIKLTVLPLATCILIIAIGILTHLMLMLTVKDNHRLITSLTLKIAAYSQATQIGLCFQFGFDHLVDLLSLVLLSLGIMNKYSLPLHLAAPPPLQQV